MPADNDDLIRLSMLRIQRLERSLQTARAFVNALCEEAGKPPPYNNGIAAESDPNADVQDGKTNSLIGTKIRADTFFGKRQQTAIREYLEMRKAGGGDAPATPRQLYEALKSGGYQFEAKDDATALIGLRAVLRKRTAIFVKLSNGTYGLTAWYPHAKKSKSAGNVSSDVIELADDEDNDAQIDDEDDEPDEKPARVLDLGARIKARKSVE